MGIFDDIKFFKDGELSNDAVEGFLKGVVNSATNPVNEIQGEPLPIQITPNQDAVDAFETDLPASQHREKFETYHKTYVDGLYSTIANTLNIEAQAVLKAFGVEDPTLPVVDIIDTVKGIVESLELPIPMSVEELVFTKLDDVLASTPELIDFMGQLRALEVPVDSTIEETLANFPMDTLNGVIRTILDGSIPDSDIESVIAEINAIKIDVLGGIKEKSEALHALPNLEKPEFPSLPEVNLEFLGVPEGVNVSLESLFESTSLPDVELPGVAKMVLDMLVGLITVVPRVITDIMAAQAQIVPKMMQGVGALLTFILGFVMDPIVEIIKAAFPDFEKFLIPAASILTLIKKTIPMLIIAIVGFLIGSGLVTLGLAKLFNLV